MGLWLLWAALAGGVAFQIWYTLAWMVLPHHHGDFESVGKDAPFVGALKAAALKPGLYIIPHYKDFAGGFKDPELEKRINEGPRAWLVSMKAGCEGMGPATFVKAFVLNALEALGLALLVYWSSAHLPTLGCVVGFGAIVGLIARFGSYGSQAIWMSLPKRYALTNIVDGVVGYAIVGLVVGLLRP